MKKDEDKIDWNKKNDIYYNQWRDDITVLFIVCMSI